MRAPDEGLAGGRWRDVMRILRVIFVSIAVALLRGDRRLRRVRRLDIDTATSLGPLDLAASHEGSTIVVDRDGRLLRPFTLPDGRWRLPTTTHDVDPRYVAMLVAYEDGRFYSHDGVDLRALIRAGAQWLVRGHVVSGGSTLPMQVARLIEPRPERTIAAKLRQIARAVEIERAVGKPGTLDRYLTLAPFGGNLEGVRAASLAYFGKEPLKVTLAEAALSGCAAAIARSTPPGSLAKGGSRGARPRARPCRRAWAYQPRRRRGGEARTGSGKPRLAFPVARRACRRRSGRRGQTGQSHQALDRRATAGEARGARQRERRAARRRNCRRPLWSSTMQAVRSAPASGSADYNDAFARRRDRHVALPPLAGFGPQALHLCAGFRTGPRPSRDAAVRPPDALRGLRAGEFQSRLRGCGDGAQGAADVAQSSGGRAPFGRRSGDFLARLHSAGAEIALPKDTPIGLAIGLGGLGFRSPISRGSTRASRAAARRPS